MYSLQQALAIRNLFDDIFESLNLQEYKYVYRQLYSKLYHHVARKILPQYFTSFQIKTTFNLDIKQPSTAALGSRLYQEHLAHATIKYNML